MAYAIVDAQGCYRGFTNVECTFSSLAQADAYARVGRRTVLVAALSVGDRVHETEARRYEARADLERDWVRDAPRRARAEQLEDKARVERQRARTIAAMGDFWPR